MFASMIMAGLIAAGGGKGVSKSPGKNLDSASQDTSNALIQPVENGVINWTAGYIRARGYAVVSPKEKNKAKARIAAERAATVIAQRNLLEIAKGVNINSETVVRDMMLESDVVVSRVKGLVKGARMVGQPHHMPDGVVMVEMEMPLYGNKGLSSALVKKGESQPVSSDAKKQLEDVPCVVIDAHGVNAKPGLMPKFFDKDGNLILDMSQIASVDPKNYKGITYVNQLGQVLDCGDESWVIQAVDAVGKNKTDLVVSDESKSKLKWLKKAGKFVWEAGKFIFALF